VAVVELAFKPSPRRVCRVHVGPGVLDALVDELATEWRHSLLVVISDSNVAPLHARPLSARLEERGLRAPWFSFRAGEASKTRATKESLEDHLYELGAGRDTVLLAVGGGVTGDIVGFVASTWHRGVPVVQVPTSLLAMVDASVGGKTGVNVAGGKNLVGTLHQPWAVYADVDLLATLPESEYIHGFAEVVKSAAVSDAGFFRWLEESPEPLKQRQPEALERAVLRSVEVKAGVVSRDEREAGRRAVLNFGHTIGHALEAVTRYQMPHGQAVAIGMCLEARIAVHETGFPASEVTRLESLLEAFGLPTRIPDGISIDEIVVATRRDKKARDGEVHYALPARLGRMLAGNQVTRAVEETLLRRTLGGD